MHLEVLKSKQKKIFPKLNNFPKFYLAGGTGLALQMGHRVSIDFDLFLDNDIPSNLLSKAGKVFKGFEVKVVLNHSEQVSVRINQVKIDFVKHDFPLILPLKEFEGIKIASITEIATMKAFALNYRGTLKDYIDLYFILKNRHTTLKEIKELTEKKYQDKFNFRLFLEQLIYLEDVKRKKIVFLKEKVNVKEIQKFFEKKIEKMKA